jgi:hypothetical protein
LELDVIASKTALGAQVMKDRSISLSAQQRSALILCDGKRSAQEVLQLTAAVGVSMQDLEALVSLGLIELAASTATAKPAAPTVQAPPLANAAAPAAENTAQPVSGSADHFNTALSAAITLCSDLGFKGFSLNMALTGVDSLEKLQKLAPDIRRAAGDAKYKALHELIFGKS